MSDDRDDKGGAREPNDARDANDAEDAGGDGLQTRRVFLRNTGIATAGLMVGCGGDGGGDPTDARPPVDSGGGDAGPMDAGLDAGPMDAGGDDAGRIDGGEDAAADAGTDPGPPPEDTPESSDFGLGVASGDVSEADAIVWTRYDGSAPLALVVWEMMGPTYARRVYEEAVTPAEGGFAHVDVSELRPNERYRYAFFETDGDARLGRSAIGRFRSAPDASSSPDLTFGAVSCTDNGRAFDTLQRAGERDDLAAFILLGDTSYNDSATTRAQYRTSWAENLGTDGYRAIRRATSLAATWDDHEVTDNWDPETISGDRLRAARGAFFENLPLRRHPTDTRRIWKRLRFGNTADLFVLDSRSERLPSTRGEPGAQYLSREQMDWLKLGLLESTATFKIICNSVPITCFPGAFDIAPGDRWEAYEAQRTEILSYIDDMALEGVLWISGDFHFASRQRISPAGEPGANQVELLCGPGGQIGNPLALSLGGDQFDWTSTTNNYTRLELEPDRGIVRAIWTDGDGVNFEVAEYRP